MAALSEDRMPAKTDPYHNAGGVSPYLFTCRMYYLRYGDLRAYDKIVSAAQNADTDVRAVAENFLADLPGEKVSSHAERKCLSLCRDT